MTADRPEATLCTFLNQQQHMFSLGKGTTTTYLVG